MGNSDSNINKNINNYSNSNSNDYEAIITNEYNKRFGDYNPIIKANNKYLGTFYYNRIKIYNLNPPTFKLTDENSIFCGKKINYIDFNPEYPVIIMSALNDGNVKLWNILNKGKENKEICVFKGHSSYVNYAIFNPIISTKVISSDDMNVKLWDINKYLHEYNVIGGNNIDKLKWNISGDKYCFIDDNYKLSVNISEPNEHLYDIADKDKKEIKDYIFKGPRDLIIFHEDRINIWDINYPVEPVKTFEKIDFLSYLYDNNLNYFYSIDQNRIDIYRPRYFNKIIQQLDISHLTPSKDIILLDSCFLKNNEIANIFELKQSYSRIIKITKKNVINQQRIKEQPQMSLNKYLKNIVYKISDYSELLKYNENIKYIDEITLKQKYVNIPELSEEFQSIEEQSIFQRKLYVQKNINNGDNIKDLKEKYFLYLKLLIRDNTNTNLIKEYLSFSQKNQKLLSSNLDYKEELNYYMVCLTKNDLQRLKEGKVNSEKDNLINFLKKLYQVKNFLDINKIKSEEIKGFVNHSFFNQPIEFKNKELFFYKLKMHLYYFIQKMGFDDYSANFGFIKDFIKKILDNNIFNNNEIAKNDEIINLLIYSIINIRKDNQKIYYDFLDLVEGKKENDDYNQRAIKMKSEIKPDDIKKFLNFILKSKTIKELISFLFGDKYSSIFTNEYIEAFINNYLKFVPFKCGNSSGMTDRLSLETYIFLDEDTYQIETNNPNDKEIINQALKIGRAIVIILHELSHNFYSYILEYYNYANLSFESPRREFLDIREGGLYVELILFGRNVNKINLEEVLFLLNEDNYNKDLKSFQRDFVNLHENKEINGAFKYFAGLISNEEFQNYKNFSIRAKPNLNQYSNKNSSIKIRLGGNCVIGSQRKINFKMINDFFEKYHRIAGNEK